MFRLLPSARQAAIYLEVPRLRDSALPLLETYFTHSQVPIDQIDEEPYCPNCGGTCEVLGHTVSVTQRRGRSGKQSVDKTIRGSRLLRSKQTRDVPDSPRTPYNKPSELSSSRFDNPTYSINKPSHDSVSRVPNLGLPEPMDVQEQQDRALAESDTSRTFVSSTLSRIILQHSLIASPCRTSTPVPHDPDYSGSFPHSNPIHDQEPSRVDVHWDKLGPSGTEVETESGDSGELSIASPKSLVRVILCRCRSSHDLYVYCRQVTRGQLQFNCL